MRRRIQKRPSTSPSLDSPRPYDRSETLLAGLLVDCDNVLQKLRTTIPYSAESADVAADLTKIKVRLDAVLSETPRQDRAPARIVHQAKSSIHSGRYLGEVSDVRFVHVVSRGVFHHGTSDNDDTMETYDQDDPIPQMPIKDLDLPPPEIAEQYLDAYFNTIHIAYPFIRKSSLIRAYRSYREDAVSEDVGTSWLALLCECLGLHTSQLKSDQARCSFRHRLLLYLISGFGLFQ